MERAVEGKGVWENNEKRFYLPCVRRRRDSGFRGWHAGSVLFRAGILRFAHGPARKKSHRGKKKPNKTIALRAKNKKNTKKAQITPKKQQKHQKKHQKNTKKNFARQREK